MPIESRSRVAARPAGSIRLFALNLDGNLLGPADGVARFNRLWSSIPRSLRPLLVYNTCRSVDATLALIGSGQLAEPDFVIGGVGTEFHDSLYNANAEFRAQFREGWDIDDVDAIVAKTPGILRQPPQYQNAFKSSWLWRDAPPDEISALEQRLAAAKIQATVVYSASSQLDVLPARAGKGNALLWLCQRLGISGAEVLVAGCSANDQGMFLLPEVNGILVPNAPPELRAGLPRQRIHEAVAEMMDGVIEGLRYFGVAHLAD
jgi:sucrose-6F-phosphate phosphohydrolase